MRKYLYFSTAVAGVMIAAWGATAQCMMEQDCASLGYTQTSCPDGAGIKCPFGSGWYCGGTAAQDCIKLGYDKDCTGAEESGSGETCNGKYVACTCAIGYEWKDGSCQKQVLNGAQGDLYYCNDTVVGVKAPGMNFYVAMQDLGYLDWNSAYSQCKSYVFCGSLKGTLPTKAQLSTIYNNKSSINSLLSTNGGTQLTNDYYWSSTYGGPYYYYVVDMSGGTVANLSTSNTNYVRPVLTSW